MRHTHTITKTSRGENQPDVLSFVIHNNFAKIIGVPVVISILFIVLLGKFAFRNEIWVNRIRNSVADAKPPIEDTDFPMSSDKVVAYRVILS
jgi:hypothetical protein